MGHITLLDLYSLLIGFYTCLLSNFTVRIHQAAFIPSFHRAGLFLFFVQKAAPFKCVGLYASTAFKQIQVFGAFGTSLASRAACIVSSSL